MYVCMYMYIRTYTQKIHIYSYIHPENTYLLVHTPRKYILFIRTYVSAMWLYDHVSVETIRIDIFLTTTRVL